MAVCGRCWTCGAKFTCGRGFQCEDCSPEYEEPALVSFQVQTTHRKECICRNCVQLIESGAVGSLISALRDASGKEHG